MSRGKRTGGLTIIELVVGLAVSMLFLSVLGAYLNRSTLMTSRQQGRQELSDIVRTTAEIVAQDLMVAGAQAIVGIELQGVLLPRGYDPARPGDGRFPDNTLAILTTGDVRLNVTSSVKQPLAALIYAEGNVIAEKQVNVLGSILAGTFDLGNQVPALMHHPGVPSAAERLCLPGTFCASGDTHANPGHLSDISIEQR